MVDEPLRPRGPVPTRHHLPCLSLPADGIVRRHRTSSGLARHTQAEERRALRDQIDSVIRGGQIVTPGGMVSGDLAISGQRIASVGVPVSSGAREIDASGKLILPGGVDVHAHIEQMSGMGQWNADTFETATRSAAMGGTTSVISFAAQAGGQRLTDTVQDYAARAQRGAMIDHAFHLTLTDTSVPDFETDLGALIAAGHRSLKVFTTYNIQLSDAEILAILRQAKAHGALVCVHAENDAMIAQAKADVKLEGKRHWNV